MRVAGVGYRKGVSVNEVLAAVEAALAALPLPLRAQQTGGWRLSALATAQFKADEPAIASAAKALDLPLIIVSQDDLKHASSRCLTRSLASLAATEIASVSEAVALAAAGRESRLLAARIARGNVTCAIAQGKDDI